MNFKISKFVKWKRLKKSKRLYIIDNLNITAKIESSGCSGFLEEVVSCNSNPLVSLVFHKSKIIGWSALFDDIYVVSTSDGVKEKQLTMVYLDPKFRGKGICNLMMKNIETKLKGSNKSPIVFWTKPRYFINVPDEQVCNFRDNHDIHDEDNRALGVR